MEVETGPMRCDSSLSMVKIQPVNENNKSKHLFTSHKFDPEIEGNSTSKSWLSFVDSNWFKISSCCYFRVVSAAFRQSKEN